MLLIYVCVGTKLQLVVSQYTGTDSNRDINMIDIVEMHIYTNHF